MDAQHRRIWIGVGRQSIEVEAIRLIGDPAIQRLELVTLKRPCLVDVAVEKLDDDPLLLYIADPESVVRQWRDERRIFGKVIEFVQKRVPGNAEGHIRPVGGDSKSGIGWVGRQ